MASMHSDPSHTMSAVRPFLVSSMFSILRFEFTSAKRKEEEDEKQRKSITQTQARSQKNFANGEETYATAKQKYSKSGPVTVVITRAITGEWGALTIDDENLEIGQGSVVGCDHGLVEHRRLFGDCAVLGDS